MIRWLLELFQAVCCFETNNEKGWEIRPELFERRENVNGLPMFEKKYQFFPEAHVPEAYVTGWSNSHE